MQTGVFSRAAFASFTLSAALTLPVPARADAAHADRQIIVALAPTPPSLTSSGAPGSSLRLGLRLAGSLQDGLPGATLGEFASAGSRAADRVFGLDPARVFLFEAADSAAVTPALAELARNPEVAWAERNPTREPMLERLSWPASTAHAAIDSSFPDDRLFRDGRQWGLSNRGPSGVYGGIAGADIHAREAWEVSRGSNALRIAIADTGIDPAHPDLAAAMPDGRPRLERATNVTDDPTRSTLDLYGHGTPVAGVMAALTNNGVHFDSLGIAGVCGGDGGGNRGCTLVPIKITSRHAGGATAWDIARAILYATRVGARAMNLSFGSLAPSRLERLALHDAITHGCVVVAAAGNWGGLNGGGQPVYPATYASDGSCIQAGGSDPYDRRAYFSSHGPGLDLLAPSTNVWTTFMTYPSHAGASYPGYVAGSGTSFAAPHVTGAVGLLAARRPELTDTDFQHLLRESADDVGSPGPDAESGWGRLNVARALAWVGPAIGIWHDEVAAERFTSVAFDTLRLGDGAPFGRSATASLATLIEARATIALPDSFVDSVRAWPRVGGTTTVRGDFRAPYLTPWCTIERVGRTLEIRGYFFRLDCPECADGDADVPLPADQARFGFTVIGRVARRADAAPPAPRGLTLSPNPFRQTLVIGAAEGPVDVLDLGGRLVRRIEAHGGRATWDGRDRDGAGAPPGLYWVRCRRVMGPALRKAIKLE